MAIFRIYPTKANTIASGNDYELLNSSQNPVADLWYGGTGSRNSISRHMAFFDLTELQSKLNSKEINENYITAYKIKYKNVVPSSRILEKEYEFDVLNKQIAASFDLIAFPINKEWDEGRGFDLDEQHYLVKSCGNPVLSGYSNWLSASSSVNWDEPGIYTNPTASTAVTQYSTQHFPIGSEDIDMDITSIVNDWLSGGTDNNGIALAYSRPFELISADTRYIGSFYTHKTNTAYKPFIEVQYAQVIKDDRHTVANNKSARLFLYLFSGNSAANYYSAGTVSIRTAANQDVYTGLTPVHHSKGVYYVDVLMTGTTKGQKFKDVWQDITFQPGIDQQTITQTFNIQGNYYMTSIKETDEYEITTYGIENNGIILPDEVRRVIAETRINFSLNRPTVDFGLEYRMVMNSVDEIIPWTATNTAIIDGCQKSFFDIDASWLLDNQTYEIALRINQFGVKKMLPERINFRVRDSYTTVEP
jgi:hypothetical protein